MARMVFMAALLLGAAAPAVAENPDEAKSRNAQNWEVLFDQYPPSSLAAGEQGLVGFKVVLDREGFATECQVTHSSGYSRLDNETCRLILNRATFRGVRDANGRKLASVHEGVVNWKLPNTSSNQPVVAPIRIADKAAPEKRVCKRIPKTGSLAQFERACHTESEWRRIADETREEWGGMQGSKGSTHGG